MAWNLKEEINVTLHHRRGPDEAGRWRTSKWECGALDGGLQLQREVDQIDRGFFFFWGGINFHLELLCNVEMNFASAFSFYKWAK